MEDDSMYGLGVFTLFPWSRVLSLVMTGISIYEETLYMYTRILSCFVSLKNHQEPAASKKAYSGASPCTIRCKNVVGPIKKA
jgi:hypothetical protein